MEQVALVLMAIGAGFMLIACLGLVRMPDMLTRMQAATKASTLGTGLIMLGAAVHFGDLAVSVRVLAMLLFIFLTVPVAAHKLARAAYILRASLWSGTVVDELKGRYDQENGLLEAPPTPPNNRSDPHNSSGDRAPPEEPRADS